MRTLPIITALVTATLLLAGCEFRSGDSVPKEDYDAVVNAYNDLKVSAEATRDSYIEQATAVDNILQELSQISGSTAVLRTDVEQGTARLNQVEMIENSIDDIKAKLSKLEQLTKANAQFKAQYPGISWKDGGTVNGFGRAELEQFIKDVLK